jgi:hypothetical protein
VGGVRAPCAVGRAGQRRSRTRVTRHELLVGDHQRSYHLRQLQLVCVGAAAVSSFIAQLVGQVVVGFFETASVSSAVGGTGVGVSEQALGLVQLLLQLVNASIIALLQRQPPSCHTRTPPNQAGISLKISPVLPAPHVCERWPSQAQLIAPATRRDPAPPPGPPRGAAAQRPALRSVTDGRGTAITDRPALVGSGPPPAAGC